MPTLYIDLMSQPSRACFILCKKYNLPVDIYLIRLDKGEHRQQNYLQINPLGKVPFLVDGDLHLPESAAIMAYLAATYNLPGYWLPPTTADSGSSSGGDSTRMMLQRRALFDAAVNWQHLTMRRGCMTLAFFTVIGPRVFNVPASPQVAAHGLQVLQQALKDLEGYWLSGGRKRFMTGDQVSVPDVLCCCELEQLNMMVAEPSSPQLDQLLAPHPHIRTWMSDVRLAVGPDVYDAAHEKLRAAVRRLAAAAAGDKQGTGAQVSRAKL